MKEIGIIETYMLVSLAIVYIIGYIAIRGYKWYKTRKNKGY